MVDGGSSQQPGELWNAMIVPFLKTTIYGAIWYQVLRTLGAARRYPHTVVSVCGVCVCVCVVLCCVVLCCVVLCCVVLCCVALRCVVLCIQGESNAGMTNYWCTF